MRLFVQIPCLDEAETLPEVLADLPESIEGVDEIEVVIIDDGSSDETSRVAREHGVRHVVRFPRTRGLAHGFMAGLDACLRLGADVVVNTDGDHQYRGEDIAAVARPVIDGEADLVIGDRQVRQNPRLPRTKKLLQLVGSWVMRRFSGTGIPDATSGLRALSRDAAMRTFVSDSFTYTLETLVQAGADRLSVVSVPIQVNAPTRPSRLFGSIWEYVRRSAGTILRSYAMYRSLRVFLALSVICLVAGVAIGARFLYFFLTAEGYTGHIQSLILAAILVISAALLALLGVLGDLIARNRQMLEDVRLRLIRLEGELARRGGEPGEP